MTLRTRRYHAAAIFDDGTVSPWTWAASRSAAVAEAERAHPDAAGIVSVPDEPVDLDVIVCADGSMRVRTHRTDNR